MTSEAPLMILGWSVKSWPELTKPTSFTTRFTLFKSPSHAAFTCSRQGRAQISFCSDVPPK
eukprot:3808799-Rhodomonas_salina.1